MNEKDKVKKLISPSNVDVLKMKVQHLPKHQFLIKYVSDKKKFIFKK